jgi:hypothetical protein
METTRDPAARDRVGGYKVDVSRGERIGRVSSEWFSLRPGLIHSRCSLWDKG